MSDELSSKSEAWKERFNPIYVEAIKRVDTLNKKFMLAMQVMDDVDKSKDSADVDLHAKEAVRYEMAVRFGIEKHKVLDILFAKISSAIDMRDIETGDAVACPDCKGKGPKDEATGKPKVGLLICKVCSGRGIVGDDTQCHVCVGKGSSKCKACGGIGKLVDHDLSLKFKTLYGIGDLTRTMHMMMQGPQQSTDQVVEMAYEQMRSAGLKGKEAEEALTMVATQIGLTGDDAKEFVAGYESYIRHKEGGSPSPSKTANDGSASQSVFTLSEEDAGKDGEHENGTTEEN